MVKSVKYKFRLPVEIAHRLRQEALRRGVSTFDLIRFSVQKEMERVFSGEAEEAEKLPPGYKQVEGPPTIHRHYKVVVTNTPASSTESRKETDDAHCK